MSAVRFVSSPMGLGGLTDFELAAADDAGVLFTLRGERGTRLFLIQPELFFGQYQPEFTQDALQSLGLDSEPDARAVFVVVHPGDDSSGATANLLAPILLNMRTGRAEQVVLDDNVWPLRAPLPVA